MYNSDSSLFSFFSELKSELRGLISPSLDYILALARGEYKSLLSWIINNIILNTLTVESTINNAIILYEYSAVRIYIQKKKNNTKIILKTVI